MQNNAKQCKTLQNNKTQCEAILKNTKNMKKKIILSLYFHLLRDTYYSKALYFVVIIFLVFIFLIYTQRRSKTKVNNNVFTEAEEVC